MAMVDAAPPDKLGGLSGDEAARKLRTDGYNELPRGEHRSPFRLVIEMVREPMVFLLLGCGGIYLLLGDRQEAGMLFGFLVVILGITWYQENKAEHALEALRDLSSPRALVLRDGQKTRVPGREVVAGDLVFVGEGDRVPADGDVLAAVNLTVDESLLTGESVPVAKPEGSSRVFAGTVVVKGSAAFRTTATGPRTELGKIGKHFRSASEPETRLARETRNLVKAITAVAVWLCVLVVVAYGRYGHPWLDGILIGLTLAMAILPNELPAVLTIFLALGAWRLSRQRVLTRRIFAVESLGTTTVLCVDKTGTLTHNRMTLRELVGANGASLDLATLAGNPAPEDLHELLEYGLLAAEQNAFDPVDRAFWDTGALLLRETEHLHPDWVLARQYPLSSKLLAVSQAWQPAGSDGFPVAAKGAPEAIVDLCHLPFPERAAIASRVEAMAARGLRVLGVAKGRAPAAGLPSDQHDISFDFLGLVGLEDPIREEVPGAVAECRRAGIRVIMITGDHAETARSIARQVGLPDPELVLTGPEATSLSDEALADRLRHVNVCARMVPEQKARLVKALRDNGEIVAMTGDGVNDAPALKTAHIGIAMGKRGTDVAREAAAMVLLDDDFASIVRAVRMGRRIYANLQRAMSYLLSVHIPIAGLSVVPVLLDLPLILMPAHIAFLHLIIEPACSIAFEAEPGEDDVMRKPPRPPTERLFSRDVLKRTMFQGISVLAILLAVFLASWRLGEDAADARTLAFTTLVIANLGLIMASVAWTAGPARQRKANVALRWVIVGSVVLLGLVLYVPPLRELFRFTIMHPVDLAICVVAGIASSLWFTLFHREPGKGSRRLAAGESVP